MQVLRGALHWRSTPLDNQGSFGIQATQNISCPVATHNPKTPGRRLLGWAMSALGIDRRTAPRTPAAVGTAAAAEAAEATAARGAPAPGRLRLAIVGDVHGCWRGEREEAALELLSPRMTLLVGDFGNEDVELVRRVAQMATCKAVILGNHDAWFTMTGRSGASARRGAVQQTLSAADMLAALARGGGAVAAAGMAPAAPATSGGGPPEPQDAVRQQLAALGDCHVGYGAVRLDEHGFTVMGARPFSKGGKNFSSIRAFMEDLYGVTSMEESAERIVQVGQAAPADHALIVMGHNGPAGLGSRAFDICGVDWEPRAGDHGDPDLQAALAALHRAGRGVALVAFGHMHHKLHSANNRGRASRLRRMVALDPATGTVYLNAATVPRVTAAASAAGAAAAAPPPAPPISPKSFGSGKRARMAAKAAAAAAATSATATTASAAAAAAAAAAARDSGQSDPATVHHFMLADLHRGEVVSARDVWVQVTPVTEDTAAAIFEAAAAAAAAASRGDGESDSSADVDESDGELAQEAGRGTVPDGGADADEVAAGPRRIGDFVVQVVREQVVLRTVPGADGGVVKFIWNAHDHMYEPYILSARADTAIDEVVPPAAARDMRDSQATPVAGDGSELSPAPALPLAALVEAEAAKESVVVVAAGVNVPAR